MKRCDRCHKKHDLVEGFSSGKIIKVCRRCARILSEVPTTPDPDKAKKTVEDIEDFVENGLDDDGDIDDDTVETPDEEE